ncbi:ABC-type branched-subunit amino acid transport system substrate-binding protein [Bradyrhizobium sp. USDA 4469]
MGIRPGFAAACVTASLLASSALAADEPGVTSTEIKIGGIFPFSGPASSIGLVGKGVVAYVRSINDRGGINGRKINYIAMDDAYSPPKAIEHARKLVESDEVSFIFGQLGTPGNSATAKYLRGKGIPSIAMFSGSSKFTEIGDYPLTTTGLVSYQTEGRIYAKFLDKALPGAKYAILFQNDDLGKDYVNAFKSFLKGEFDKRVVTAAYEVTEPTVDSQVVNLKSSGAEALFVAGTAEVCRAGDPQGCRDRLEGQGHRQLSVEFDRGHVETGGSGKLDRRHRRYHQQGPNRFEVEW